MPKQKLIEVKYDPFDPINVSSFYPPGKRGLCEAELACSHWIVIARVKKPHEAMEYEAMEAIGRHLNNPPAPLPSWLRVDR